MEGRMNQPSDTRRTSERTVKDLMVPLDQYGVVSEDATLLDAIQVYDEAMKKRDRKRQPFRAVLVQDKKGRIVGKLGQLAFLKALEPQHHMLADMSKFSSSGVSEQFISSVLQHYRFFEGDITSLAARARSVKVRDMMHPVEEFIDENSSLSEAIYKLVLYDTLSILVTRKGKVVGLVRLDDVCQEVAMLIKEASPK